jgi:hypothetical protein
LRRVPPRRRAAWPKSRTGGEGTRGQHQAVFERLGRDMTARRELDQVCRTCMPARRVSRPSPLLHSDQSCPKRLKGIRQHAANSLALGSRQPQQPVGNLTQSDNNLSPMLLLTTARSSRRARSRLEIPGPEMDILLPMASSNANKIAAPVPPGGAGCFARRGAAERNRWKHGSQAPACPG